MKSVRCVVVLLVTLVALTSAQAQSKKEIRTILDSVLVAAKTSAVNSRKVNWDSLEKVVLEKAKYAKSVTDLRGSLEAILITLKDRQGLFLDPTTSTALAGYPGYQDPELPANSLIAEVNKAKFECKLLRNGVCYVRVVSIPYTANVGKEATTIRKAIEAITKSEPQNWIIDLRYMTGGNAVPVLAGLAPLFGQGVITSVVDGKSKARNIYAVHNGKLFDKQEELVSFGVFPKDVRNDKIAVLTSKYTAGAGEVIAVAMKGRKDTRFFGERTAGKPNGTNYVTISKNLVMSISDTQYLDRKGVACKDNIKPDSFITFEGGNSDNDKITTEASYWLTSKESSQARK